MPDWEKQNKKKRSQGQMEDPLAFDASLLPTENAAPPTQSPGAERQDRPLVRVEQFDPQKDTDAVISAYLPWRRLRRLGMAMLRLNKLQLLLVVLLLVLVVLFLMAFAQEKMGNFTINLNRLEMYRKGISIATDPYFSDSTARLTAQSVAEATNISIADLPDESYLDLGGGSHNGENYMAYSYYLRNAGKEDVGYVAQVILQASTKGAEQAMRVAVWHNGQRTLYAAPAQDGGSEEGCVNFADGRIVCRYEEPNFLVGNVDRFTVVVWLEGDDPECVDAIVGGSLQLSMDIDADYQDETSLWQKFVQDIRDMLTGNRPIYGSSDADVPDFYKENDINWYTRRNRGED